MNTRRDYHSKSRINQARRNNAVRARSSQRGRPSNPRAQVGSRNIRAPFAPPEDWYNPVESAGYKVIARPAGLGYFHILTEKQIRERLATLPAKYVEPLEVVQLSQMTRKKKCFPCYGMQWGASIYLYPLEEDLVETFYHPPRPSIVTEAKMYGGKWSESAVGVWTLRWTEKSIQDFYLNNILIHELGHLLDERNSSYSDRERYAEWFAIEHGYRATGGRSRRRRGTAITRRHHAN